MLHLKLRRQTRNHATENTPLAESIGWVRSITAVRRGGTLPANSPGVEGDRMDVYLTTIGGSKYRACRQVVLGERKTERHERGDEVFDAREFDNDVNVLVLARLLTKQRVNPPPAVEPGPKADREQGIEQFDDLFGSHPTVIPRSGTEMPRSPATSGRSMVDLCLTSQAAPGNDRSVPVGTFSRPRFHLGDRFCKPVEMGVGFYWPRSVRAEWLIEDVAPLDDGLTCRKPACSRRGPTTACLLALLTQRWHRGSSTSAQERASRWGA